MDRNLQALDAALAAICQPTEVGLWLESLTPLLAKQKAEMEKSQAEYRAYVNLREAGASAEDLKHLPDAEACEADYQSDKRAEEAREEEQRLDEEAFNRSERGIALTKADHAYDDREGE